MVLSENSPEKLQDLGDFNDRAWFILDCGHFEIKVIEKLD